MNASTSAGKKKTTSKLNTDFLIYRMADVKEKVLCRDSYMRTMNMYWFSGLLI